MMMLIIDIERMLFAIRPISSGCNQLGCEGSLRNWSQVEMFDEFFKELVGLIFVKPKEGYFEFFEVPPAFNVFVVKVVVYPVISSQ